MNFTDKVLIRLADPATRKAVFDPEALEQFASAVYDTSQIVLQGPFDSVFEELQLGMAIQKTGDVEGQWGSLGASERSGVNLQVTGMGGSPLLVDALWTGYIVARVSAPAGRITTVTTSWPDASAMDREIVQALGALPAGELQREQARRARMLAHLRAAAADPDVVTDAMLDRLLATAGAQSVNEFFDRYASTVSMGPVRITISPGPVTPPLPKPLPVSAAILVRDAGAGWAQLLADSKFVRTQLESAGMGRPNDPSLRMLRSLLVVWVLPANTFADNDWPGADLAARRRAAGQWLAKEGIGLATVA